MTEKLQRQIELQLWDQAVLSPKRALVLGAGGLGTHLAMDVMRLGFAKVVLIDMDVVDDHNLNRQILYSSESVGKPKVEESKKTLDAIHRTRDDQIVEIYNFDVVKCWDKVVPLICDSDFVFNSVDYGDYFDAVMGVMCKGLNIPLVLGGTEPFYGHTVSMFCQVPGGPTFAKIHELPNQEVLKKISDFEALKKFSDLTFLPKDQHPTVGGSTIYSAGICSHMMTALVVNYFLSQAFPGQRPPPPTQSIFNLMSYELTTWRLDADGNEIKNEQ
eukprot:TRINITY_DN66798_c10_g2_i1.p1 TRINITY_DN66798_c10_g2~~TRINITY_DN66798_c10_g2_i1.p1  ORF type:complete len:292 (-),score=24.06 TRINITY_DN66798_c10_g2_i1:276-1094(-)